LLLPGNALCLLASFGGFLFLPGNTLGLLTNLCGFLLLPGNTLCFLARLCGLVLGLYACLRPGGRLQAYPGLLLGPDPGGLELYAHLLGFLFCP
jgi:hypothetical protein